MATIVDEDCKREFAEDERVELFKAVMRVREMPVKERMKRLDDIVGSGKATPEDVSLVERLVIAADGPWRYQDAPVLEAA